MPVFPNPQASRDYQANQNETTLRVMVVVFLKLPRFLALLVTVVCRADRWCREVTNRPSRTKHSSPAALIVLMRVSKTLPTRHKPVGLSLCRLVAESGSWFGNSGALRNGRCISLTPLEHEPGEDTRVNWKKIAEPPAHQSCILVVDLHLSTEYTLSTI